MTDTAASVFDKVPTAVSFPAIEERILAFWEGIDAFHESNRRRQAAGAPDFVFYDGPPFATGTPHYGHLLAGTLKDIVPRYWSMRGYHVPRRFGWDCHGLPIEALAQKALDLHGTAAINATGVDVFNEQCRSMVFSYVDEWRATVTRMGRWVDFDDDYKTMDLDFMESVWWVFRQLWDQGRVYRAHRVMPYSPKLATPLARNEVRDDNYQQVDDPAITCRFRMRTTPGLDAQEPVYLLAWTTTPWTLPSNLALCVGAEIDYVAVRDGDAVYVLAEARIANHYKKPGDELEVLARFTGADMVGWTYEPLFDYFADRDAFRVVADDYVTTSEGTGIVHQAPAYGEDDYRICMREGLPLVDPLDAECRFTAPVEDYAGLFCKDADKALIRRLKDEGKLVHQASYRHPYPFCDRTDFPLIYRAIDAWYVRVEDLRDRLVANNASVRWVPDFVGGKRFSNWLAGANDWNVSRNRFWGSCIPIWINEQDPEDMICIGSRAELEDLSGQSIADLHKHTLDPIVIERDGKRYRRTPEVLDCWFESGSMPYAQVHYPFERAGEEDSFFPAHFIAEGLDQTRGWFYTLLVLGTALFDRSPFHNVIVNGIVLAEDGTKMSKSKMNYPDPNLLLDQIGADALRTYLIDSPLVRAEPLAFSEKGLREIVRRVILPYWNALSFFTTYAVVDGYDPRNEQARPVCERGRLDRWILSTLQSLIRDVNHEMEAYRLYNVVPRVLAFIDDLTNWYIRNSRRRFWKSEDDRDKADAYATLYTVLVNFAKVLAPMMPFLTEEVYQRLVRPVDPGVPESVHWCDYPVVDERLIDGELEASMAVARTVVGLGRRVREEHRIRVRQPLAGLTVVHREADVRREAEAAAAIISEELNVKAVDTQADESAVCEIVVKPDFRSLRQRCPHKIKDLQSVIRNWGFAEVARLEAGESIEVDEVLIGLDDVLLERKPKPGAAIATDGNITVVLDTELDRQLEAEGIAREFVSAVQNARKEAGLEVTDRIALTWRSPDQTVTDAIDAHAAMIAAEVLAAELTNGEPQPPLNDIRLGERPVGFAITRV
ncbi:MAG: isoleucine--tRNA ligase [Planctomycetota bacterium]